MFIAKRALYGKLKSNCKNKRTPLIFDFLQYLIFSGPSGVSKSVLANKCLRSRVRNGKSVFELYSIIWLPSNVLGENQDIKNLLSQLQKKLDRLEDERVPVDNTSDQIASFIQRYLNNDDESAYLVVLDGFNELSLLRKLRWWYRNMSNQKWNWGGGVLR